jgi:hypothetical protein
MAAGGAHLLPDMPTVACCPEGRRAAVAGGVDDLLGRPIGLDLLGAV